MTWVLAALVFLTVTTTGLLHAYSGTAGWVRWHSRHGIIVLSTRYPLPARYECECGKVRPQ